MVHLRHDASTVVETARKITLSAFLDYFIPAELQARPDAHRRARMFMLSHVFGPFLGNVIPIYLHFFLHIPMDYRFWTFTVSICAFWTYPILLRTTKRYQTLAFISVQNLSFCILWACYSYGGIYSPFLPWSLIIPLLSFLYLPATGLIRNVLLVQIYANVAVFATLVIKGFPFPPNDLRQFQVIGIISTISASIYVAMMALYFAKVFRDQGVFERELGALAANADNLRNLTEAAQQATIAKAHFVASMSHELRTPLNAVIGYSELLLDDARDENDDVFAEDVERIRGAGRHLLRLVDDILDFSKIEAGKVTLHPSEGLLSERLSRILEDIKEEKLAEKPHTLDCDLSQADVKLNLDWHALKNALKHLVVGVAGNSEGGAIAVLASVTDDERLVVRVVDPETRAGHASAEKLFDIFADEADASNTKYGGAGIAFALSRKFAQLMGGDVSTDTDANGLRVFTMTLPVNAAPVEIDVAA